MALFNYPEILGFKAMAIIFPLFIILALSLTFSLWSFFGLQGVLGLTFGITEFCQNLFVRCLEYSDIMLVGFFWSGGALLAIGLVYSAIKGLTGLLKTRRALKRLPLKDRGSIVLIDDGSSCAAFTHGLFRPKIYISRGLVKRLDSNELRGVFLHELHHKRSLDPLKFFLISLVKDAFFYIPAISHLAGYLRWKREHDADDSAASVMREPMSLAGALVKVARRGETGFAPASITGGTEANPGTIEARISRLLTGKSPVFTPPGIKTVAVSLCISTAILLSLAMPLSAGPGGIKTCTIEHCSLHADKLGDDCRTHCEPAGHMH